MPERAFSVAAVSYIDKDASSFSGKVSLPHTSLVADIITMTQQRCELLFLLNPEIFPKGCVDYQLPGTRIITNNHHSTARHIMDNGGVKLISVAFGEEISDLYQGLQKIIPFEDDILWETQNPKTYAKALAYREAVYATGLPIFLKDNSSLSLVDWLKGPGVIAEATLDADEENWFSESTPIPFPIRNKLGNMVMKISSMQPSRDSDLFLFIKL